MSTRRTFALLTATAAAIGGLAAAPAHAAPSEPDAGPRPQGGRPGCYVHSQTRVSYTETCPYPGGYATTYRYRRIGGQWRLVSVWHGPQR